MKKIFVLNPSQQEAVEHIHGPMLVIAGAGTGKTTVLVERIARLIAGGHARPEEILATTYTNNAAGELKSRVRARVREITGRDCRGLEPTTFHGYCYQLLARARRDFRVLDDQDIWIYLRRQLKDLGLEYYTRAVNPGEFLEAFLDFFSRCHDDLVDVADYRAYVERLCSGERPLPRVLSTRKSDGVSDDEVLARCREIARVYEYVEQKLVSENLGTFGHMILRAVQVLRSDPQLLASERARARFILIDEFQDANLAQIELSHLLAGDDANIFAVGDPDQAIYRFRGASSAAFEEFSRRVPQSRTVVLAENQRSTTPILRCAFAAISANPDAHCRVAGRDFHREPLVSARDQRAADAGELPLAPAVELVPCTSDELEAADVAQAISDLRRHRPSGSGKPRFGVLYRLHSHREHIARELAERGIPFSVTGINALETAEVRDLLACLRVVASPGDTEALFRVAALPVFGLDAPRVREALAAAGRDAAFEAVLAKIPGAETVLARVAEARQFAQSVAMKLQPIVAHVLARFEFDNLSPALAAMQSFIRGWSEKPIATGDLPNFLEYMHYFPLAGGAIEVPVPADDDDINTVRLMTMHVAKGLEFDHVFLLRVSQNSFPARYRERIFEFPDALRRGLAAEGDGPEVHRQEERRLFYVGMTRARDSLAISARAGRGKKDPRPLGFVRDLMEAPDARSCWRQRVPAPARVTIHAAAPSAIGVGAWLLAPPSARMQSVSLSASAVEAYETCPLRFKLQRDWNIPGGAAAAMLYGNIIHTVLRDYYDAHLAGRPRTIEQTLSLFRELVSSTRFDDTVQRELYEKQGTRQLTEFVALRSQTPPPQVIATERTFDIKIANVLVKGRVDRLDRIAGSRVAIVDYKTGGIREQKDADKSLQLSLYAIAAREKWELQPERLVIYNLEDNSEVATTRKPDQLESARAQVLKAAAGIAAGHFDPTPGFHCRNCNYRNLCPATEQKLYTLAAAAAN